MNWIKCTDRMPAENETVWMMNIDTKWVSLGCLSYAGEEGGWLWAESNGSIYNDKNKIVSKCEWDDEYDVTHWHPLPEMLTKEAEQKSDGILSSISHSDIKATLIQAEKTIEYMNSLINDLAVSETETYYNTYANTLSQILQTKASL